MSTLKANTTKENIRLKKRFRLKRDEIRYHILEEIQRNDLISEKHKKVVGALN